MEEGGGGGEEGKGQSGEGGGHGGGGGSDLRDVRAPPADADVLDVEHVRLAGLKRRERPRERSGDPPSGGTCPLTAVNPRNSSVLTICQPCPLRRAPKSAPPLGPLVPSPCSGKPSGPAPGPLQTG